MAFCTPLDRGLEAFCGFNLGGIVEAYFADYDSVDSYGLTGSNNNVISTITMGSTSSYFYQFNFREDVSSLSHTNTPTNDADIVDQIGTLVFQQLSTSKNTAFNLLRGKKLVVVYKDANGQYWLSGKGLGARVTNIEQATGADRGDSNIYTLTITARENDFCLEVLNESVIPVAP
jgi:hypothetical protein